MAQRENDNISLPAIRQSPAAPPIALGDGAGSIQSQEPRSSLGGLSPQAQLELDELKQGIVSGHRELTVLAVRSAAKALQIGTYVLQAKQILGHGRYSTWVEREITPTCGLALRTVQRYAKLARESTELIERIRHLNRLEDGLPIESSEATHLLQSMPLSEALNILQCDMLKRRRRPAKDELGIDHYEQAAARFFGLTDAPFATHVSWARTTAQSITGHQFISTAAARENRSLVTKAVASFREGNLQEAVLLLCAGGADRWIHQLDEFPRVLLRQVEPTDSPPSCPFGGKQFLFGLIGPDRFEDFNDTFQSLGAVFVPFGR